MFCLVAITYTSPKVSVTANKRVPGKKNIFVLIFKIFVCFCNVQKFVTGLTVRDNDQIYEVLG